MTDKSKAHAILVKEELGINTEELSGSAMEAALTSFFLFIVGAIIPVIPFFKMEGWSAVVTSIVLCILGLFGLGGVTSLFTGKNFWFSGFRMVFFGLAAAAITFGIGHLIGVSLAG